MKYITLLKKQMTLVFVIGVLLSLNSCGSFQYSGIYDDGIYSESTPTEQINETVENTSDSSDYYKNYFKEKSLQIEEDNTVFTDVDSYNGSYEDDVENTNNYAGWGENNSSEIIINVYDNGPYFGNGWGYNYRNNWGWNLGWNNWGFGFWQPNYYNSWINPYCYYGCYNFGFYNYGYNRYRGRSYSYINGQRRLSYRNSNLSSRSVLSTTSRNRTTYRPSSRSTTRTRTTTRPTNSRATNRPNRSSSTVRPTTTRPNRGNSTSRPSSTRPNRSYSTSRPTTRPNRNNSTTRPNTTTRPTRSSTRSSSPSTTRSSSTRSSSSGSSSPRRRNN